MDKIIKGELMAADKHTITLTLVVEIKIRFWEAFKLRLAGRAVDGFIRKQLESIETEKKKKEEVLS